MSNLCWTRALQHVACTLHVLGSALDFWHWGGSARLEYHVIVGGKLEWQIQNNATSHTVLSEGIPCKLYQRRRQDSARTLRWMSTEEGEAPEEIGRWGGILGSNGKKYNNYSWPCAFGDAQILARVHPRKKIGRCSCMDKCCPHATA
jgi:hypothetical protein